MYGLNDIMIWVLVEERIVEFIGVYGVFSKVLSILMGLFLAELGATEIIIRPIHV